MVNKMGGRYMNVNVSRKTVLFSLSLLLSIISHFFCGSCCLFHFIFPNANNNHSKYSKSMWLVTYDLVEVIAIDCAKPCNSHRYFVIIVNDNVCCCCCFFRMKNKVKKTDIKITIRWILTTDQHTYTHTRRKDALSMEEKWLLCVFYVIIWYSRHMSKWWYIRIFVDWGRLREYHSKTKRSGSWWDIESKRTNKQARESQLLYLHCPKTSKACSAIRNSHFGSWLFEPLMATYADILLHILNWMNIFDIRLPF